jgi:hypothetical protein
MYAPRNALLTLALSAAITGISHSANAQSIWMPPTMGSHIQLEAMKPSYSVEGVGFWTSAWYLGGLARLSPAVALYLEVPFASYEEEGFESQSTIGNPYVGIVYGSVERRGFVLEAGGRIPAVSEQDASDKLGAIITGWTADFTRFEAFAPETIALKVKGGGYLVSNPQSGLVLKLMLGAHAWIPTGGGDGELVADVDMGLWKLAPKGSIGAVISEKTLLTQGDLSLTERSEFQLGLSGSMRFGQVEPGIHLHLPLGNEGLIGLGELVDVVWGVNCTVHLGE